MTTSLDPAATSISPLRQRLIAGECPAEALRGAYGQINRQSLRVLVAELGACG